MTKLQRISIELPFILNLPNREYEVETGRTRSLSINVFNGYRKLVRWQQQANGKEVRLVNIAHMDEIERWVKKIRSLRHDEEISIVRARTVVSLIQSVEDTISIQQWSKRKFPEKSSEEIVFALNRLLDASRWAGVRKDSNLSVVDKARLAKVHNIGAGHFLEFVVELFRDTPTPENYLWQLSIFREMEKEDREGHTARASNPRLGDLVQWLVNREMPAAVRLQLDALSSLIMHNPSQAAFLYWAWVDIELNNLVRSVKNQPTPEKMSFHSKITSLFGKEATLKFDGNSKSVFVFRKILDARKKHRNPMIHGSWMPTEAQALQDFQICDDFIRLLNILKTPTR